MLSYANNISAMPLHNPGYKRMETNKEFCQVGLSTALFTYKDINLFDPIYNNYVTILVYNLNDEVNNTSITVKVNSLTDTGNYGQNIYDQYNLYYDPSNGSHLIKPRHYRIYQRALFEPSVWDISSERWFGPQDL